MQGMEKCLTALSAGPTSPAYTVVCEKIAQMRETLALLKDLLREGKQEPRP